LGGGEKDGLSSSEGGGSRKKRAGTFISYKKEGRTGLEKNTLSTDPWEKDSLFLGKKEKVPAKRVLRREITSSRGHCETTAFGEAGGEACRGERGSS